MKKGQPTNQHIADLRQEIAELLTVQDANRFRIQAYERGAALARQEERSLAELARQEGESALEQLPDIGSGLANVIIEYVKTGQSSLLNQLKGETAPEKLFASLPGVGPTLAARIVDQLDIHSLEQLEQAAHDGRLAQVEGFGSQRIEALQASLAAYLSGAAQRHRQSAAREAPPDEPDRPDVATLLTVDAEYRRKAAAGELQRIAPKRFNPQNEAWLPIYHTTHQGWKFTALFSNTARAHELEKTHDWVVIYYETEAGEKQVTVTTATRGDLEGKRVVRGREAETREYYTGR